MVSSLQELLHRDSHDGLSDETGRSGSAQSVKRAEGGLTREERTLASYRRGRVCHQAQIGDCSWTSRRRPSRRRFTAQDVSTRDSHDGLSDETGRSGSAQSVKRAEGGLTRKNVPTNAAEYAIKLKSVIAAGQAGADQVVDASQLKMWR
jgi:hypothetical protein